MCDKVKFKFFNPFLEKNYFGKDTKNTEILLVADARRIKQGKKVTILYEVIETAPSETVVIDGVKYQKSLNFTGKIDNYFSEYLEILNYYKELTGIDYEIRYQHEFNEQPETQEVFKTVLKNREYVAKKLDQKYGNLRVRMSCPICGLTDKNSVNNIYTEDTITFYCPERRKNNYFKSIKFKTITQKTLTLSASFVCG